MIPAAAVVGLVVAVGLIVQAVASHVEARPRPCEVVEHHHRSYCYTHTSEFFTGQVCPGSVNPRRYPG